MPGATLKKSNKLPGPAADRLKAIFLLGTLKARRAGREFSHTETLCELVISLFARLLRRNTIPEGAG
jgi:hypothetical protein